MAGEQAPGPLGRNPFVTTEVDAGEGTFAKPGPVRPDGTAPEALSGQAKITKVVKRWTNPPTVDERSVEVSGQTLADVKAELDAMSEWGSGGGDMDNLEATTTDGVHYTVELNPTFFVSLPKWKQYGQASPAAKKAWDDMLANLRLHEMEHVRIALRGYEQLARKLQGLPPTQASTAVSDGQTATQAEQDDFDSTAKTDHGHNAWGRFPKVVLDTSVQ